MAWITTLDLDKRLEETQALFLPIEKGLTEIQAVEFTKLCCQARGVRSKLVEVSSELDQMLQKKKEGASSNRDSGGRITNSDLGSVDFRCN